MTSENPTNQMGDSEQKAVNENQLLDLPPDLTNLKSNDDNSHQSTSQNSPVKRPAGETSPTKARNRRKNEARRRSANLKKQANETDKSEKQTQRENSPSSFGQHGKTEEFVEIDNSPRQQHSEKVESVGRENTIRIVNLERQNELNKERFRELKELKDKLKLESSRNQSLVVQIRQQFNKIKELDTALVSTTRTCNQLDKLLQQELTSRTRLEVENESLTQTVARLKTQLIAHEKNKSENDELVRTLNATLMERDTEVSILKLKLTRIQTNPSSTIALDSVSTTSLVKSDPRQVYATTGRSASEFDRNSYIRSSMIAEAASTRALASLSRGSIDRNASIWATVPEELTPSKRPLILEKNLEPLYSDPHYSPYGNIHSLMSIQASSPLTRDRRYRTLPRSMKSPSEGIIETKSIEKEQSSTTSQACINSKYRSNCQITNLDDSNNTSHDSGNRKNISSSSDSKQYTTNITTAKQESMTSNDADTIKLNNELVLANTANLSNNHSTSDEPSHYYTIDTKETNPKTDPIQKQLLVVEGTAASLPIRSPTTPIKLSTGLKRIFHKFRRSDSSSNSQSKTDLTNSTNNTPITSPFKRGANRATLVGAFANDIRAQMSPVRQVMNFQTDKPFAEWDADMLVEWLTMIGLSMYTTQCRRWVKCGAHIMNATPAEVDKGLGITNHLHRKKLRLAISELNGDCDKVTKAAARLDYLWVARWLDDVGLPQYKEAFINARIDGRVLNYLTVEDLVSMGVKSVLHHASIRCGIRVLRSINFDLQLLRRRATAEEVEQMSSMRQQMNQAPDDSNSLSFKQTLKSTDAREETDVSLWTCHRVMEWLRLIDFAEFAPNLRGSGVHGGLIVFEDGFNIDTISSILSIPIGRTLLRRHLLTFFNELIGEELVQRKRQYQDISSNQQLNPLAEIKAHKKTQLWFTKMKSSRVGQDGTDEYLCPMYPVQPQINKNIERKSGIESVFRQESHLKKIPESINV